MLSCRIWRLSSVLITWHYILKSSFLSDINECVSSPCANGASCLDLVNMFSCSCVAGYTGVVCQTSEDGIHCFLSVVLMHARVKNTRPDPTLNHIVYNKLNSAVHDSFVMQHGRQYQLIFYLTLRTMNKQYHLGRADHISTSYGITWQILTNVSAILVNMEQHVSTVSTCAHVTVSRGTPDLNVRQVRAIYGTLISNRLVVRVNMHSRVCNRLFAFVCMQPIACIRVYATDCVYSCVCNRLHAFVCMPPIACIRGYATDCMHSCVCNRVYAIVCMQSCVCIRVYATDCMQSCVCNRLHAIMCMQLIACNRVYATDCMQSCVCNRLYAFLCKLCNLLHAIVCMQSIARIRVYTIDVIWKSSTTTYGIRPNRMLVKKWVEKWVKDFAKKWVKRVTMVCDMSALMLNQVKQGGFNWTLFLQHMSVK